MSAAVRDRSCDENAAQRSLGDDLYPQKIEARWAKGFHVTYHGHYKVLEVFGSGEPQRFVLLRCGFPKPDLDLPTIEVPIRTLATTSTTELAPVVSLDVADAWVGHADMRFVSDGALRQRIDEGQVAEIGGADGLGLDIERLLTLGPDLLLVDNLERAGEDRLQLLRDLGSGVVPVPSYRENSPLARAEWLKVTALFFDLESKAEELFQDIEREYETLRRRVAEKLRNPTDKPTALTGGPWQGVWYVAGGQSFMARLVADAGGAYFWADTPGPGPLTLDIESVFERAGEADVWLYPSHWRSLKEIEAVDERLAAFRPFREHRIYAPDLRLSSNGGNDFWEYGVHRPDVVLADLVAILHPELLPGHVSIFHRRLEEEPPAELPASP